MMSREIVFVQEELVLTPVESKKNFYFDFFVDCDLSHLFVDMVYQPKFYYNFDRSMDMIMECVKKYGLDKNTDLYGPAENLLPMSNLLVLTLDMNGKYLGAAHRSRSAHHIVLTGESASPGFAVCPLERGKWRACITANNVITDKCVCRLTITGIRSKEETE